MNRLFWIHVLKLLVIYLGKMTFCSAFIEIEISMINSNGSHYPKGVILYVVFFYDRYAVSYRDLKEIMAERGVKVDHTTLKRWVIKFSPLIAFEAQRRKFATNNSWRMDETYIKVKGKWTYYYRAVDKNGQTLDFILSE